jgi:hypothetical protein
VQLQSATLLQNQPWVETVFALGDFAYRQVLQEGVAPAEAVRQMYEALKAEASRYGITVPEPDPAPLATPVSPTATPPAEPTASPDEEGASPAPAATTPTPGASP